MLLLSDNRRHIQKVDKKLNAEFSIELRDAFIAQEEDLRKIAKLLSERIGPLEINIDCADGINRKFSTINELLQFENPPAKSITRLRMSAHSEDFKKRGEIDLSDSRWRGISIKIQAREDVVGRLKEELLDTIATMRPAYAWLHKPDFFFVGIGFASALGLLPALLVAFDLVQSEGPMNSKSAARVTLVALLMPPLAGFLEAQKGEHKKVS